MITLELNSSYVISNALSSSTISLSLKNQVKVLLGPPSAAHVMLIDPPTSTVVLSGSILSDPSGDTVNYRIIIIITS